jgi:hypothetical protein
MQTTYTAHMTLQIDAQATYTQEQIAALATQYSCPNCDATNWVTLTASLVCNDCALLVEFMPVIDINGADYSKHRLDRLAYSDYDIFYLPQRYLTNKTPMPWDEVLPARWLCSNDHTTFKLPESSNAPDLKKLMDMAKKLILLA